MSSLVDPVYFAVSGVMWCWHQLFGLLLGPASGAAWALSVVFLVLTLRALLIRPFLAQLRSGRAMQAIAPQVAELRKRHADDPKRLLEETRALQSAHGVSALGGCLPALVQLPVFLGLLHVLTSFNRRGLTLAQNGTIANYAFTPDDVRSFLEAHLFGVPLSSYLTMPQGLLDAFGAHVDRWEVALVVVPLTLLAAVATHFSARHSVRQQPADGPAASIMRWTPWIFPAGVLVSGVLFPFPIAILLYLLTNSTWTLGQQWLVHRSAPQPLARPASEPPPEPLPEPAEAALVAVRERGDAARRRRRHPSGHRPSRRRR
ncbi:membrane protein insertase YidC [Pseudonocardia aurantiaca]|uniref:Membrane protein insertase YidC n=1 Tax=Pseudonocardia aurantiaca TaxID=75290 RepID=A0ABW4FRQ2_9PSEU